ncbi:ArsA family ATPase [Corynebacterium sp. 153RC1]|uniref:ArsA family ATPase n=1 Tax=unclassified Corynebacterium TaxID=2624378 RepID=UPI00211C866B|nr:MULTISPECIES: ArsA family ATPase [unclassified Corynebacterium]MCQ9370836.1 ArsA family ATPase [Corynebacterium sp. 35RC1]MCQ9352665.1 ArsA family ATPase [Corynebacterium sp. 209RC1]MCQ9354849.1 ArsA family ATPase [Corynebacterium sp. 1222RC1]MCQ9357034.1 ArsA family ATPase [Corynebacterium sp. 122RC1]MCQ9359280.1 ArsA family ATPase [Corynebacterium sp. 142RC1]
MLLAHKISFFGGKGGVGKTTCAAAAAVQAASAGEGRRVLLVSTDPAHNLGHLWGMQFTDTPTPVPEVPGLEVVEIDPAAATKAHLHQVEAQLRQTMPEHLKGEIRKHLQLAENSPGAHEAAVLERITEIIEQAEHYDHIVFDTAPSGHTVRLMELPELMQAWTEGLLNRRDQSDRFSQVVRGLGGEVETSVDRRNNLIRQTLLRRRERFAALREVLTGDDCAFYLVLLPERLPVLETIEVHRQLEAVGMNVAGLVINRMAPTNQGEFLAERAERDQAYLAMLREALPGVPTMTLPLMNTDVVGTKQLREFFAAQ